MNGKTYYGIAKEKEEAAKEFEERISAGENAGLVESRYRALVHMTPTMIIHSPHIAVIAVYSGIR